MDIDRSLKKKRISKRKEYKKKTNEIDRFRNITMKMKKK